MNDMFFTFLTSLSSLALLMAAGYLCRKLRLLDDNLNAGLTSLLVKVTLPCTAFNSMMRPFSGTLLVESLLTLVLSGLVFLCGGLLAAGLAHVMRASPSERRIWQFSLIFANVGYMGFPVSQAVFGDEGLIYTSMANAAFNLLAFSVGVRLFNAESEPGAPGRSVSSSLRQIALNPALLATLAGFICFLTGFRLPEFANSSISMLGSMTTPISMLLVGSILAKSKLRTLFTDVKTLPVIAFRLAVIPLIALLALRPFVQNPMMLGVIVVLSAMPVASLTVIFAEQYKGDTALASRLVALSTLLCVATVPFIALFIQ